MGSCKKRLFCLFGLLLALLLDSAFLIAEERTEDKSNAPVERLNIESGDSYVKISWRAKVDAKSGEQDVKGFRLYQIREGTETGYRKEPYKLLADLKTDGSYTVKDLGNGEQYIFVLKAYDHDGREFWQKMAFGFPGINPEGRPKPPENLYASAGDKRAAIFWDKNTEKDLIGYEVYRKGENDEDFRLIGRTPKVFRFAEKAKDQDDRIRFFQAVTPAMFVDTAVVNGKRYDYKVRALDSEGYFSDFTNTVGVRSKPYSPPTGDEVLLLVKSNSGDSDKNGIKDSEEVARYYAEKRGVPARNILSLVINPPKKLNYQKEIQKPVREFLLQNNLAGKIKYIVPCYGMPIRAAGRALDSKLADIFDRYTWGMLLGSPNPYFGSKRHFDGTYGLYLVTRVDGPTVEIAKSLVDKAIHAGNNVRADSGKACFATKEKWGNDALQGAKRDAESKGIRVVFKEGIFNENELPDDALWYFAWRHPFKDPKKGNWPVGAVGAHLISDSFHKIRDDYPSKHKSWVQGLLEKGITGTFGAVIEPYFQGYTRPDIFFEHFWSGEYNFAESFYMATPTVQWAMSAVGDPLFRLKKPSIPRK